MFKNADNVSKLGLAPAKATREVEPFVPKVVAAGLRGDQTVAMQVTISQWSGKLGGAQANTLGSRAHRLEVGRIVQYENCTEDNFSWLKTRLGPKQQDRHLRPYIRNTVMMYRTLHGLPDGSLKAWFQMYDEIARAIAYCQNEVAATNGADHYGLIILADLRQWKHKTPENGWDSFYEAVLTGISDLEVIKLAPETSIELPDGFSEDPAYKTERKMQDELVNFEEVQALPARRIWTPSVSPKAEFADTEGRHGIVDYLLDEEVDHKRRPVRGFRKSF